MARAPKYSADTKALLRKTEETHMMPAYLEAHLQEIKHDKENFKWTQRLKPSGMSFDMCLEEFQDNCDKYSEFALKQRMKFLVGSAVHKSLAELFARHPDVLYPKPAFPERIQKWADKAWPEIPLDSIDYRSKMVADLVPSIKGAPVVIDWKTTWQSASEWKAFCAKPLVPTYNITQVCSYVFHMNRENYYPVKINSFGLVFINLMVSPDERLAWKEVWFDYQPFAVPIEQLWDLALEALEATIKGVRIPCKNPGCPKHGKGEIVLKADPWHPITPPGIQEWEDVIAAVTARNEALDRAGDTAI